MSINHLRALIRKYIAHECILYRMDDDAIYDFQCEISRTLELEIYNHPLVTDDCIIDVDGTWYLISDGIRAIINTIGHGSWLKINHKNNDLDGKEFVNMLGDTANKIRELEAEILRLKALLSNPPNAPDQGRGKKPIRRRNHEPALPCIALLGGF